MKQSLGIAVWLQLALLTNIAIAQNRTVNSTNEILQDRNFYLLSLFQRTPGVSKALRRDPVLGAIAASKRRLMIACKADSTCITRSGLLSPSEIRDVSERLDVMYSREPSIREMVAGPVRQCGFFILYQHKTDRELLTQTWLDASQGIDQILETYGLGSPARYPQIDSPIFDLRSELVSQHFHSFSEDLVQTPTGLFFEFPLRVAIMLLELNHRDEASRFEPLDAGENAPALRKVLSTDWTKYKYTAIVVPGEGPEDSAIHLTPVARVRIGLAVKNYRAGLAPFILVSGGFVHPSQTPYCEAIEMKKALVSEFAVPPEAILIEPYARHTTTNLRNAARLIYRSKIPFDKPVLVTTDSAQSEYIESRSFKERNETELGYLPYRSIKRTSPVDLVFLPSIDSLEANSKDPLDP